jgi:hypothetical protein
VGGGVGPLRVHSAEINEQLELGGMADATDASSDPLSAASPTEAELAEALAIVVPVENGAAAKPVSAANLVCIHLSLVDVVCVCACVVLSCVLSLEVPYD